MQVLLGLGELQSGTDLDYLLNVSFIQVHIGHDAFYNFRSEVALAHLHINDVFP